jgi:hypothetical protein
MKQWQIMDYCSEADNNLIEEWYHDLSMDAQAAFDWVTQELSGTADWRGRSDFKALRGKHSGFAEIIFRVENVQYRPVGCFGPSRRQFTLLVGCYKKQKVYNPPDAFDRAIKRWSLYKQGKATICEHFL